MARAGRVPAGLIYSTVVPAGMRASQAGLHARGACRTTGEGIRHMRFMKIAMAICAVCASMLAMSGMRRKKMMMARSSKRRGMMRSRHR